MPSQISFFKNLRRPDVFSDVASSRLDLLNRYGYYQFRYHPDRLAHAHQHWVVIMDALSAWGHERLGDVLAGDIIGSLTARLVRDRTFYSVNGGTGAELDPKLKRKIMFVRDYPTEFFATEIGAYIFRKVADIPFQQRSHDFERVQEFCIKLQESYHYGPMFARYLGYVDR